MTRGARSLTKKEKDRIQLDALIDSKRWILDGTMVKEAHPVPPSHLKFLCDKAAPPYPRKKFLHNRHVVEVNVNIWAYEVLTSDEK